MASLHLLHYAIVSVDGMCATYHMLSLSHTQAHIHTILYRLTVYWHIKTAEQRIVIQQYGDSYTVAVDGWAVTFGTAREGLGEPARALLAVPNVKPKCVEDLFLCNTQFYDWI